MCKVREQRQQRSGNFLLQLVVCSICFMHLNGIMTVEHTVMMLMDVNVFFGDRTILGI